MRYRLIALSIIFSPLLPVPAHAEVSVAIAIPGISIGINMPAYPRLVLVPGYPVYYDPYASTNYFFYDGMYWVYQDDSWYASYWYNGPWDWVAPEYVPLFVLRIPIRYYRRPPPYFYGWRPDAPPPWGRYWGRDWEEHHRDWDHWDRRAIPAPAPLPIYQREYSGNRYPREREQQRSIQSQHYRYRPREDVIQQHSPLHSTPEQQRQYEQRQDQQMQRELSRRQDQQRQQEQLQRQNQQRQQEQMQRLNPQLQQEQLQRQNQQRQQEQLQRLNQQRQQEQLQRQDQQRQKEQMQRQNPQLQQEQMQRQNQQRQQEQLQRQKEQRQQEQLQRLNQQRQQDQ